jgi:hypothetical protein
MPGPIQSLQLQSSTGPAGLALQNGTPTLLTYTAPADGNLHVVEILSALVVTTLEVGGAIGASVVGSAPFGNGGPNPIFASAQAAGSYYGGVTGLMVPLRFVVGPGCTVNVAQTAALTGGAAAYYGEIWAS